MSENKTQATDEDVLVFLTAVEPAKKREDALVILDLMQEVTGLEPVMWGTSIIGFGSYHYKYESGREGDMPLLGFSPRKQALTLYITSDFERYADLMAKLGKYTTGKVCLYIKKLADVDMDVLKELIQQSYLDLKEQ